MLGTASPRVTGKKEPRPGREDFRKAIEGVLPKQLPEGDDSSKKPIGQQIREMCARVTSKTWKADIGQIDELAARLPV